jgi:hypothetical protein
MESTVSHTRRLDDDELELLESLVQEATEGPWRFVEDDSSGRWQIVGPEGEPLFEEPSGTDDEPYAGFQGSQSDYRLVAAVRVALPGLLSELRRLRGLLERARRLQADLAAEVAAPEPEGR